MPQSRICVKGHEVFDRQYPFDFPLYGYGEVADFMFRHELVGSVTGCSTSSVMSGLLMVSVTGLVLGSSHLPTTF